MLLIADAAATGKKASLITVYLSGGWASHLIGFLFLTALVFAWLIHCRGMGLRFRAAFFLMSFIPLLASICAAAAGFIEGARWFRDITRVRPGFARELVSTPLEVLSVVSVGASETLALLAISSLLFLSKNAEPLRRDMLFRAD